MIIQIYEIQDPYQAEKCVEAGVDHVGSVLLGGDRWRHEGVRDAARVLDRTGSLHSIIPLFSGEDVYRALDYYMPDFVHFCDDLTDEEGRRLPAGPVVEFQIAVQERFPEVRVIRTIPVQAEGCPEIRSTEMAREFEAVSDLLLIDTWTGDAPVNGFIGITGRRADPGASRSVVRSVSIPVILAGGLGVDNVYETAIEVMPAGVDSCTRTNITGEDGKPVRFKKDFNKVKAFVAEARRAGHDLENGMK